MNEKRQIEAMLSIDKDYDTELQTHDANEWPLPSIPAYLTSHDAVQPVIDGLSDKDRNETFNWLWRLTNTSDIFLIPSHCGCTIQATPAQKVEAILKATGKWEQE